MKFCSKCGAQLEDDARFCAKCGNPTAPAAEQPTAQAEENTQQAPPPESGIPYGQPVQPDAGIPYGQPVQPAGSKVKDFFTGMATNKNRLIGFIVTCVLAVIVLILVINLASCVFGGGYETPIKKLCNGMEDGDAKEIMEAFPLDGVSDALGQWGLSMDSLLESLEDSLDVAKVDSVSYKIKDKDKVDSDDYRDHISSSFAMFVSTGDIDAMYELEVEMTVKINGEKDTQEVDAVVAKIDGDWKLVGGEMVDSMF